MIVDHIFIFSQHKGREADELIDVGFVEGSSRIHPGQGTRNRKFYFGNFFLEILWVSNHLEITDDRTAPTKLWERANFMQNDWSRFGLCLVNSPETDPIFQNSLSYQPIYFPQGMAIDVLTNEHSPFLPWTFRLPFKGKLRKADEPREHPNGIQNLSNVGLHIPYKSFTDSYTKSVDKLDHIQFTFSQRPKISLTFDAHKHGKSYSFDQLDLEIKY